MIRRLRASAPPRGKAKNKNRLAFGGPVRLLATAAAEDGAEGLRRFTMLAYTGGPIPQFWSMVPIVVDLAGMQIRTQQRPILLNHDTAQIVGHSETIDKSATDLNVEGVISGAGPAAAEVATSSDNGFPWQASIGADILSTEELAPGAVAEVNGQQITGPATIVRASSLVEISFVPLGADDNTSAIVAADAHSQEGILAVKFSDWLAKLGFKEADLSAEQLSALRAKFDAEMEDMKEEESEEDAEQDDEEDVDGRYDLEEDEDDSKKSKARRQSAVVQLRRQEAAEIRRVAAIRKICARAENATIKVKGQDVGLEAHAVEQGWTADQTELHVLRASRPSGPAIHSRQQERPSANVIQAALCRQGGLAGLDAAFDERTLEASHRAFRHGIGLQELIVQAAWANGYTGSAFSLRSSLRPILQAAFSNADIGDILSNVANKFLLEAYGFVENTWQRVSVQNTVTDFKEVTRVRLLGDAMFEEVGPDGELKHGELSDEKFTNKAQTFGKLFGLTREDLINDDLGALTGMSKKIGRGGALKINDVFWRAFLDNAAFFTEARANYAAGADTALSSDSLQVAEQMFLDQTDPDGNPAGIMPAILLTPTALGVTARELYQSTNVNTGGSSTKTKVPNTNIWAGKYRPEVSTYLNNASFTGRSAKAWYLLADPADVAVIELVFLNGQQTPIVESSDADFKNLGIDMRGYFDFGAKKQEYRGGVKMLGEAEPA